MRVGAGSHERAHELCAPTLARDVERRAPARGQVGVGTEVEECLHERQVRGFDQPALQGGKEFRQGQLHTVDAQGRPEHLG